MPSIHLGQIIWKICVCHIIILDFAIRRDLLLWNGCRFVWATYHTWKKTVLYASHLQCHAGCFLLTQIVLMRVFHSKIDLESNNVCWTRGWSANYAQALWNIEGCSDLKLCNTKVHCVHTHNCVYDACCTSWMQCKYSDNGNITPLTKEPGSAAVKQTCLFIL